MVIELVEHTSTVGHDGSRTAPMLECELAEILDDVAFEKLLETMLDLFGSWLPSEFTGDIGFNFHRVVVEEVNRYDG